MSRIDKIVSVIPKCNVLADIGCDHGYVTEKALQLGLCKRAVISDVSANCLKKAEKLLAAYIEKGVVESRVSDGFSNVPKSDCAVIAGMGGEEISSIILAVQSSCDLPEYIVAQPMKNAPKLRSTLVGGGYKIVSDKVFKSGKKFYDLILARKGKDVMTDEEEEFGRDNVRGESEDFKEYMRFLVAKTNAYLLDPAIKDDSRKELLARLEKYKKYV